MPNLVLGADGGGTKTAGILADESGKILIERSAGPSNPNVVGIDSAAQNLSELVRECCEAVQCSVADIRSAVLGLAGAGRASVRERLREELSKSLNLSGTVTIETDARVALEGAFGGGAGIVVIAGTGSVVIGKGCDGVVATVGGWGRVLGDEGSGYALGVAALKAVTASIDAGETFSPLASLVAHETKVATRDELLAAVYQNGFDPSWLAPLVLDAAAQGDATAQEILEQGATALAAQARLLAQRLSFIDDVPVVLVGGLVQHDNVYRRMLVLRVAAAIPRAHIRTPMHAPVFGAVLMALQQAGYSTDHLRFR